MASITKTENGYLAQVRRGGVSKSKRFARKTDATMWAAKIEAEIDGRARGDLPNYTLLEAIERFEIEVSPNHRGHVFEKSILRRLKKSSLPIYKQMSLIVSNDIAAWRDHRCTQVKDATVNREMGTLWSIFSVAAKEWGYIRDNPCVGVKKKPRPLNRDRLISADEELDVLEALNYPNEPPASVKHQTAVAFIVALESGMRLGEILSASEKTVMNQSLDLRVTKNGTRRVVPLSKIALDALGTLEVLPSGRYFKSSVATISQTFIRFVKTTGIVNLRFHDTRHEAITRLSKVLSVMELARMIGHNDLKSLMIYYNETPQNIANKLNKSRG